MSRVVLKIVFEKFGKTKIPHIPLLTKWELSKPKSISQGGRLSVVLYQFAEFLEFFTENAYSKI